LPTCIGLSPAFATLIRRAILSLFKSMSPVEAKISPGIISVVASANWVVNAYEFCSIRESCFHLHLGNHLGDAFHHQVTAQHLAAFRHEIGDRLAIAGRLQDEIGYQRKSLGVVELDTSFKPLPSDNCGK